MKFCYAEAFYNYRTQWTFGVIICRYNGLCWTKHKDIKIFCPQRNPFTGTDKSDDSTVGMKARLLLSVRNAKCNVELVLSSEGHITTGTSQLPVLEIIRTFPLVFTFCHGMEIENANGSFGFYYSIQNVMIKTCTFPDQDVSLFRKMPTSDCAEL